MPKWEDIVNEVTSGELHPIRADEADLMEERAEALLRQAFGKENAEVAKEQIEHHAVMVRNIYRKYRKDRSKCIIELLKAGAVSTYMLGQKFKNDAECQRAKLILMLISETEKMVDLLRLKDGIHKDDEE